MKSIYLLSLCLLVIPLLAKAPKECPIYECAAKAKTGGVCKTMNKTNGHIMVHECPKGSYCDLKKSGRCKSKKLVGIGGHTNLTAKCNTGIIVNDTCRGIPLGEACEGQDCDLGLYCKVPEGGRAGFCRKFKKENDTCVSNFECPGHAMCKEGECIRYGSLKTTNDSRYLQGFDLCENYYVNLENFTCGTPPKIEHGIINGTNKEICNYTGPSGKSVQSRLFTANCDVHRGNKLLGCEDLAERSANMKTHPDKAPVGSTLKLNYGFSPAQMNETGYDAALSAYCHLFANTKPDEDLPCIKVVNPLSVYCEENGGFGKKKSGGWHWTWKSALIVLGIVTLIGAIVAGIFFFVK